jgi:DNA replication protein DnaC
MMQVGAVTREWLGIKTSEVGCMKHREMFTSYNTASGVWSGCPKCADERDAEVRELSRKISKELSERSRIADWLEKMERCGIPERFRDRSLESFVAKNNGQKQALDFSVDFAKTIDERPGRCAIFVGKPGTGKTHLAVGIGLELLKRRVGVSFITAIRALRRIKDTWSKNAVETESEAVESLVWPQLLILDEVGVQFGSDAEKILLFDVMNERYEKRKSTIILSNLSVDEIKGYLGERIFDRMREDGGECVVFDWESHRGKSA